MKKVRVVCVGKIKEAYLKSGIDEYVRRLGRFCDFSFVEIADCADVSGAAEKESAGITARLGEFNVLTDIDGQQLSSEQISKLMDDAYANGVSEITFIIGGSRGVSDRVKRAANVRLSFGKVTFPHQLMRLMLCEQIYRAMTISANMPYHK